MDTAAMFHAVFSQYAIHYMHDKRVGTTPHYRKTPTYISTFDTAANNTLLHLLLSQ
jgi:hypothetical protein